LIFDEVTDITKLAPFYGSWCGSSSKVTGGHVAKVVGSTSREGVVVFMLLIIFIHWSDKTSSK